MALIFIRCVYRAAQNAYQLIGSWEMYVDFGIFTITVSNLAFGIDLRKAQAHIDKSKKCV